MKNPLSDKAHQEIADVIGSEESVTGIDAKKKPHSYSAYASTASGENGLHRFPASAVRRVSKLSARIISTKKKS